MVGSLRVGVGRPKSTRRRRRLSPSTGPAQRSEKAVKVTASVVLRAEDEATETAEIVGVCRPQSAVWGLDDVWNAA